MALATWLVANWYRSAAAAPGAVGGRAAAAARFVAVGLILVAARSAMTPVAAAHGVGPLPGGDGPWPAIVESIGAPKAGQQPAIVQPRRAGSHSTRGHPAGLSARRSR